MTRREVLVLLAPLLACARSALPEKPQAPLLKLDPLVDLVPAPGLVWLIEARPMELLANPVTAPALGRVVPSDRFDLFAEYHGGVDLRRVETLVVAWYPDVTLSLARTHVHSGRVEAAFTARTTPVEGRVVEGGVTRLWGGPAEARQQVAVFGSAAVGLERGHLGPLRAAVYFAQGKLRRALPALRSEPLAAVDGMVGPAPLRLFAPGPFEGLWSAGLGGLLRATTAAAATMHPTSSKARTGPVRLARDPVARGPDGALELQFALAGAWGADATAAADRLGAAFQLLANDPLGRLLGLDHLLEEPRISGDAQALRLQVVVDPLVLARGLHASTDARIEEIMAY